MSSSVTTPRVALVTCADYPQLYAEEQDLPRLLARQGVDATPVVWSDPEVAWRDYDCVALRSTWDYFVHFDAFRGWLARMGEEAIPLQNPLKLVQWNLDKRYLRELEAAGALILPTRFVEKGERLDLAASVRALGCAEAILKPAVSGGAFRTHRFTADRAAELQTEMDSILETSGVLIQPFFDEIIHEGEWSLLFFDGEFSHAVLKTPGADDFRVQMHLGGTFVRAEPDSRMIADAMALVRSLPEPALYARVDGVRHDGRLLLMELELIEPYLYLADAPEAAERYAAALARRARSRPRA